MNIVVLAIDTLRASQLSCYGYHHQTSPVIDSCAEQGLLFEDMICSAIPTHPSFTTLYTGQHPMTHGIVAHAGEAVLDRRAPMLPRILLRNGWRTGAVDNLASAKTWFRAGYEYYLDPSQRRPLGMAVTCTEQNQLAAEFIRHAGPEPFFLFVHYWEPHTPYLPPERYRGMFYAGGSGNATDPTNRSLDRLWQHPLGRTWRDTWFRSLGGNITDADYVRALYDGSIRYADQGVGDLLSVLDEEGVAEDTLVVIVADHGECLGEHDVWFDHHGLYEENIRVPLVMRWPAGIEKGARVSRTVSTVDFAPTLLDLAGIDVPEEMDGESLASIVTGMDGSGAPAGARDFEVGCECMWQAKWSLRTPEFKLIVARSDDFYGGPPRELYDRTADPGEEHDIALERPDIADALQHTLEEWIAKEIERLGRSGDPVIEQGREKFNAKWREWRSRGE